LLKYGSNYFDTPAHIHVDRIPDDEPCSGTFDGTWTGTESYSGEEARQDGLVVAKFRVAPEIGADAIVGTGKDSFGIFEISGTLAMDGSTERKISYKTTYCPSADIDPNTYAFEGTLKSDDEGNVVSMEGDWGEWPEDPASFTSLGTFQFTRTPLIAVRHRPSIDDFEENPARARWNMALNVVEEQVRRKLWTWEYFEQRSEARKSYVDAVMASRISHISASYSSLFCSMSNQSPIKVAFTAPGTTRWQSTRISLMSSSAPLLLKMSSSTITSPSSDCRLSAVTCT